MKAIRYDGPAAFYVGDLADPQPGAGEALIAVRLAGVCGTDLHVHAGGFGARYPLTPGHEVVGEVVALGAGEHDVQVGQLVAIDNMISCGQCRACREGSPGFCEHLTSLGITAPGGFAELMVAPSARCYPVDGINLDTAVLAEPLSCAVHGLDVLGAQAGADVLVVGAGPTGLILTQLLRSGGAGRLTVCSSSDLKLALANRFGADMIVKTRLTSDPTSAESLRDISPGGFDIVVDATGVVEAMSRLPQLLRPRGTLLVYGMADETDTLPVSPYDIFRRELTIKGSFARSFEFGRAVRMLETGRISVEGMVTHRFGLREYDKALAAVRSDRNCVKAVIDPAR